MYAESFRDRVRALTLDAVIDPFEWTTSTSPAERDVPVEFPRGPLLFGTYEALLTFLGACAADARCAFREGRAATCARSTTRCCSGYGSSRWS